MKMEYVEPKAYINASMKKILEGGKAKKSATKAKTTTTKKTTKKTK